MMADNMELIKGIRDNFRDNYFGKFNSYTTRNARQVCQWSKFIPFSANRVGKNLNLLVLECQKTKSTKRGISLEIRDKTVRQIDVLPFIRIVNEYRSVEARQN